MVYQLQRPSIEMIIDYCRDLLADEKLEVYEFGDDNDRKYEIAAIDADEGDESDNDPQIMIIF